MQILSGGTVERSRLLLVYRSMYFSKENQDGIPMKKKGREEGKGIQMSGKPELFLQLYQ